MKVYVLLELGEVLLKCILFVSTSLANVALDSVRSSPIHLPRVGPEHPSSPLVHLLPHLFPVFTFLFLSLALPIFFFFSIPSFSTRIVPLRFQAGGRRRRPNLGLVCCVCVICIP